MKKFKEVIKKNTDDYKEIRALCEGPNHCFAIDHLSAILLKFDSMNTAATFNFAFRRLTLRRLVIGEMLIKELENDIEMGISGESEISDLADRMRNFNKTAITREELVDIDNRTLLRNFMRARGVPAY